MRTAALVTATIAGLLVAAPAAAAEVKPALQIARSTAPVGVDVPYTITVTPKAQAQGKRVRIQVKTLAGWKGFDTFRVPKGGVIKDDVEGYQPGVGKYRVVVLGPSGAPGARSNTVSVTWTAPLP